MTSKYLTLGNMFYQGELVDQDLVEARRQFKLGWEEKGFKSGYNYAKMLNDGVGGDKDIPLAYNIFSQICTDYPDAYYEMSKSPLCNMVSDMLFSGQIKGSRKCALEYGKFIECQDEFRARESYEFAATGPNDEIKIVARERLGILQKKNGDTVSALNNLIYASENDRADAQYHLGLLFLLQGRNWAARNEFMKAADNCHDWSNFELCKLNVQSEYVTYDEYDPLHQLKKLYDRTDKLDLKDEIAAYIGNHYCVNCKIVWEGIEWYSKCGATRKIQEILEHELELVSGMIDRGEIDKAEDTVHEVQKRSPATGDLASLCYFYRGLISEKKKNLEDANECYGNGIGYDGCRYRLAYLLTEKDPGMALFHLNQILENSKETHWISNAKILKERVIKVIHDQDELPPLVDEAKSDISDEYIEVPSEKLPPYNLSDETSPENITEVSTIISKIFGEDGDEAGNIYVLGYIYMLSGDIKKAKEEFKKSARMGHRDSLVKLGELSLDE